MEIKNKKIIDISLNITEDLIVYPGNPPVEFSDASSETSELTKLSFGSHTGTHIDAPRHAKVNNDGIDSFPLSRFIGPCKVIDATSEDLSVSRELLEKHDIKKGDRVLLKTNNSIVGFNEWRDDYIFLSPDGASYLADRDVALVGIDWLSVKERGNPDNRPHTELLSKNIPILEGIDLSAVEPGQYNLIFLPLKMNGLDGAPGRAVLIEK